jgi:hypothetical protein
VKPGYPSSSWSVQGVRAAVLNVSFSFAIANVPLVAEAAATSPTLSLLASPISVALGQRTKEVSISHDNSQATDESTLAPDLAQLYVQDLAGQSLSVVAIAKGRPTFIVFLRHFG